MIENNVPPHLQFQASNKKTTIILRKNSLKLNKNSAGDKYIFNRAVLPYVIYTTHLFWTEYIMHLSNEVYDIFSIREDVNKLIVVTNHITGFHT